MSETVDGSDFALGLGLFFGVLSIVGALGMYLAHGNQTLAGASFAVAVAAGAVAVAAVHVWG